MDPHKIDFGSSKKVQTTHPLNFAVCFFSATSITFTPFYQPRGKKERKLYNVLVLPRAAEST